MNKVDKKLLITLLMLVGAWSSLNAQVVYFNGLGRALVTAETLGGNVLYSDSAAGIPKDTASKRKSTDGYSLFDLGVNAQPNETLRASAILRVRNAFGGFYGDGSSVIFRQIRLDGIIAKKVKYEIGDIDLGLSPYTLYNFDENYRDYEATAFAQRRSIVEYENFNFGNKWRLQGMNVQTSFRFNKIVEKIAINGFASRIRKTDFLETPDRLIGGGRVELLQSKYLQLGGNIIHMGDLAQTAADSGINYKITVMTLDFKASYGFGDFEIGTQGEFGNSRVTFKEIGWVDTIPTSDVDGKDFFYDAGLFVRYKPMNIKLAGSYREVGYYFTSPGAQTRRIYDYGGPNALVMFPKVNNDQVDRPANIMDRMSDETSRNLTLQPALLNFLPQYNNITPYGQATPNRKGLTIALSGGDVDRLVKADVIFDNLSEIVAEGTPDLELRKFMGIRGGALLNVNKLLRWEKSFAINGGLRYEKTTRGGTNNYINFTSSILDAGMNLEVFKSFDLLVGYKVLAAKGNEFVALRDAKNRIEDYNVITDMDEKQALLAYGIRYRFSKNTYFTVQGYNSENTFFVSNSNYRINQFFLNYTMIF